MTSAGRGTWLATRLPKGLFLRLVEQLVAGVVALGFGGGESNWAAQEIAGRHWDESELVLKGEGFGQNGRFPKGGQVQ